MANEVMEKSAPPPQAGVSTPTPPLRVLPARSMDDTAPGEGSPILLDMAIKRLEMQDRAYDGLTTRTGAIFGFTTFLVPKCADILKDLAGDPRAHLVFGILFCAAYLGMGVCCFIAMKVRSLSIYPNVAAMALHDEHQKKERELKHLLFQEITDAYARNEPLIEKKARALGAAMMALMVLIGLMVAAYGVSNF